MWPEVEKAKNDNRHELVLFGDDISARIQNTGLDPHIFDLNALNYLDIQKTCLDTIPDAVVKLENLQSLALRNNKIKVLNPGIATLRKLKLLDVSHNQIEDISFDLNELPCIETLNFAYNELTSFARLTTTTKLSVLNLNHNHLEEFPDVFGASGLAQISLEDNRIEEIPGEIGNLAGLKVFEMRRNKIRAVPGELVDCGKLKTLDLQENPIKDNRFSKLIKAKTTTTKQLMDYIKKSCPRRPRTEVENDDSPNDADHLGDSSKTTKQAEKTYKRKITVRHASDGDFKVVVHDDVKGIRDYIVTCIVNDVTFTAESLKKFIKLQNGLHQTVCKERNICTIATHDRGKLPQGDLVYTTMLPKELQIKPLNQTDLTTGEKFLAVLQKEAESYRKRNKLNTLSHLHKYLTLVKNLPRFPCLKNSLGAVISFPPLTNSDVTKIDLETKSMLLEVTSSVSLKSCKDAMEALLKGIVLEFDKDLEVLQVQCVDPEGTLRVVYPARDDLVFDDSLGIKIERN